MKFIAVLTLLFATAVSAQAANALNSYSYRVKLPNTAGQSCADHATQVAGAFAAANGKDVSNVTSLCQGQQTVEKSFTVDIVVVNYQATNGVLPYRAVIEGEQFSSTTGASSEPFATYASCLAALSGQASYFTAQTGLASLAAYCAGPDSDMYSGYIINLEGFGTPQKRLHSFMNTGVGGPDYTVIVPVAANLITSMAGQISYQDSLRVFFYSDKDIHVDVDNFSYYEANECEDQKGIAEKIAVAGGQTNVSSMCLAELGTSKSLIVVGLGFRSYADDFGGRSPDYASYSECVQDRPRMMGPQNDWLLGALCEPSVGGAGHYQLHMFTKGY